MPIPPILHPPLDRLLRARRARDRHRHQRRHHSSLRLLHVGTPCRQRRGGEGRAVGEEPATRESKNREKTGARQPRARRPAAPAARRALHRRRPRAFGAVLAIPRRHRRRRPCEPRVVVAPAAPARTRHAGQPVSARILPSSAAIAAGSAAPSSSRSIASASARARLVARRISLATVRASAPISAAISA